MTNIDKSEPVMVSGGSGYLASRLVKMLLEAGFTVHVTVRDAQNPAKVAHLTEAAQSSPGLLKLFCADLLQPGSFDEAMKGCAVVFHTASPFVLSGIKDVQKELIEPALKGTENILASVNQTDSVKRVVLTSSVVSVMGDNIDIQTAPNGRFDESCWNDTSSNDHQSYSYSKTLAEKRAWTIAKAQQRWSLVTINPGFILGPSLTKRVDSTSIGFMKDLLGGKYRSGLPQLYNGVVDVRDVAQAHINAAINADANGRYVLVAESLTLLDLAKLLKPHFGSTYPLPGFEAPKWLLVLLAPMFERTRKYARLNFNIPIAFDNSRSIEKLGIEYRPVSQTLVEHAQQIIDDGLLK